MDVLVEEALWDATKYPGTVWTREDAANDWLVWYHVDVPDVTTFLALVDYDDAIWSVCP